jgi:hypothetical protein
MTKGIYTLLLAALVVGVLLLAAWLGSDDGLGPADPIETPAQAVPATELPPAEAVVGDLQEARQPLPVEAPPAAAAGAEGDGALPATVIIFGRVEDPDGELVDGATLAFYEGGGNWSEREPLQSQTTGDDGRFRFEITDMPDGETGLVVTAEGFSRISMSGTGWSQDETVVRMYWAATVSGVVRDAELGTPVAGALVAWSGTTDGVLTAGDGTYVLEDVTAGFEVSLSATHPDYAPAKTSFLLSGSEPARRDFALEPGVLMTVTVVDRDTQAPLPGAAVRVHEGGDVIQTCDAAGRFSLRSSEGTSRAVVVDHEGHGAVRWIWDGMPAGEGRSPRLPLPRVAWIDGQVTDDEGEPVPDAYVYVKREGPSTRFVDVALLDTFDLPGMVHDLDPGSDVGTDEQGLFHLVVLPSSEPVSLRANHDELVDAESAPLTVPTSDHRPWVTLVLRHGGSIRGKVLHNGEPMTSVDVLLKGSATHAMQRGWVGEDGGYSLAGVAPGEVTLVLRNWMGGEELEQVTLVVESGQELEHDFIRDAAVQTISGRVTWSDGSAAAGLGVWARVVGSRGAPEDYASTDAEGLYSLMVKAGGVFDVNVRSVSSHDALAVAAGTIDVDFVLPGESSLELVLIDAGTGAPLEVEDAHQYGSWLAWRSPDQPEFQAIRTGIDLHGRTKVDLPVGPVDLHLSLGAEGYESLLVTGLVVTPTPGPPVEIALTRGSDVRLRLVDDATGEPGRPDGHQVFVVPEAKRHLIRDGQDGQSNHRLNGVSLQIDDPEVRARWTRVPSHGEITVRGLAPGRHVVLAFPDDLVLEPDTIDVPRSGDEALEIRHGPRGP